jgi:hypothetical protein
MALAALLLVLALLCFGGGLLVKGLFWLAIIGICLLLAGIVTGVHSRQRP